MPEDAIRGIAKRRCNLLINTLSDGFVHTLRITYTFKYYHIFIFLTRRLKINCFQQFL